MQYRGSQLRESLLPTRQIKSAFPPIMRGESPGQQGRPKTLNVKKFENLQLMISDENMRKIIEKNLYASEGANP